MRIVEIMAAGIIGVLLLLVGYELGKSKAPEPQAQEKILASRIKQAVEKEIALKEQEMLGEVISRIEKTLEKYPQYPVIPEVRTPIKNDIPDTTRRIAHLEKELDELITQKISSIGEDNTNRDASDVNRDKKDNKLEPFDTATLREFEEARKKMLEERRKQAEKEGKR